MHGPLNVKFKKMLRNDLPSVGHTVQLCFNILLIRNLLFLLWYNYMIIQAEQLCEREAFSSAYIFYCCNIA